jgi:Fe-Mn family superoxide dismutase
MQPKHYQFSNLAPELSTKMFEDHWKLYVEHIERLNNTIAKLSNPYDPERLRNAGGWRDIENDKTSASNAVMLHELFFENVLMPPHSAPMPAGAMFTSLVQSEFPHVKATDFWSHIIKPTAKAANGWCIVGWDTVNAKLDVTMMDSDYGPCLVGLFPIIVIDTHEHAYAQQYGIDKGTYLEHIARSLNWSIIEHRIGVIHSASELMRTAIPEQAEDYVRDLMKEQEHDFGFPNEDSYNEQGLPPAVGLDSRNEQSVSPNPRVQSSVEGGVTQADLQEAHDRIKALAKITFRSVDNMFDEEVRGKTADFRKALWERVRGEE